MRDQRLDPPDETMELEVVEQHHGLADALEKHAEKCAALKLDDIFTDVEWLGQRLEELGYKEEGGGFLALAQKLAEAHEAFDGLKIAADFLRREAGPLPREQEYDHDG